MKQLTIHVPDQQLQQVVELLSQLGFVKIDEPQEQYVISDGQRTLVNDEIKRIANEPGYLLDWHMVKDQLFGD